MVVNRKGEPAPPIPPRPDQFPQKEKVQKSEDSPQVHAKSSVKKEDAKLLEGTRQISKTVLSGLEKAWTSMTASEAKKVEADLGKIYGGEKNALPFYGFARHEEIRMPHRGADPAFPVYATKMGDIFKGQKAAFLKSIEGVQDPVHRMWLLKKFDNYRMNVFVASMHEIAHRSPEEAERLFNEFETKASTKEGRKSFSEEVKQVLEAESKGNVLDKGSWAKKPLRGDILYKKE